MEAVISKEGRAQELRIISGRQWRWQPTYLDGEPVEVETTIQLRFALNQ